MGIEYNINKIQDILLNDSGILQLMDLTNESIITKVSRIIKRSKWEDIVEGEKRICIFYRPTRRTRNQNVYDTVIEIDIHVPSMQDYIALRIAEKVFKLMNETFIANNILRYDGELGELATIKDYYCYGIRFFYKKPIM